MKWMVIWNIVLSAALIATVLVSFFNLQDLDKKVQQNMAELKGDIASLQNDLIDLQGR